MALAKVVRTCELAYKKNQVRVESDRKFLNPHQTKTNLQPNNIKGRKAMNAKQKKMKFNSVIASIIWGAMVLTGCPQPNGPTPEPTYPETLVDNEKETIKNLNGNTYSELLANIDTILNIENIPAEYKAQLKEVRDVLANQEFLAETYNNLFSDSLIEKQEMATHENMSVREQKSNDNYTNYSAYEELYNNYKSKVEEFNDKIQGYNDVKVNYDADYTNYENAYNTLNNTDIKTDAYNDLINFMINIRNDFKDNYFLDKEENLASYTKENAEALFNNAVAENDDNIIVNAELASTKDEYNTSKQSVENAHAVKSDIDAAYSAAQDADVKESTFEFRGSNENVDPNPSVFTYADDAVVNANNYNDGDNITISIPATENEEPTTVNIAKLYEQYTTIAEKVGEKGSVSISYADAANTTIEGEFLMTALVDTTATKEVEKYAKIKSFVDAITPKTQDFPKISADIGGRNLNLYHTGIVDLFNLYYNNNACDKLPGPDNMYLSTSYIDALDHLNEKGGIAYDETNTYNGNYYNLDVNAALLMSADLKNVNVVGKLKENFKGVSTLTNVRFNVDSNGNTFEFGENVAGIGLIEFAGDAPSMTPRVNAGRLVLNKVNQNIIFQNGFSIDVSALSANDIANSSIANSGAAFAEVIYGTTDAKNAGGFISSSVRVGGELVSGTDYYATNQQWVKAANENKWIKFESGIKYPDVSNLSAKLNLDEKNNNNKLLNTILYNNQKVYG